MDADEGFILLLTNKATNDMHQFEGNSYSKVLAMAYSFLLKELKKDDKGNRREGV
jgi:hypothetical protein